MAKISATQRLIVEDFPEQKDWIGNLLDPVNEFITKVLQVVNGGIEFSSNVIGLEREFDFVYVSDTVSFPQAFRWTLAARPQAFYLVSAQENDPTANRVFSPVIVAASWSINAQGEIELNNAVRLTSAGATSLTVGRRYKIKVRVTP